MYDISRHINIHDNCSFKQFLWKVLFYDPCQTPEWFVVSLYTYVSVEFYTSQAINLTKLYSSL